MTFLHNIVADLREKNLLPVVALLVLAAIAIPVLLRSGEQSRPQGGGESLAIPKTKVPGGSGQSIVTLEKQPSLEHKKLDAFKRKNPFVQQARSSSKSESGSVTPIGSGGSGDSASSSGSGETGAASSGSGGGTAGSTTPTGGSGGGTAPTGGSPDSSGSTSGDTGSSSAGSSKTHTKFYRWTVTVRFGLLGEEELRDDLMLLSPLPSSEDPVVTFLGVSQNSRAAVFLLDRGVLQEGEGTCRPSKAICAYVYLHEDAQRNEHTFYRESDPNRKYRIKLKSVDLVESKSFPKVKSTGGVQSQGNGSAATHKRFSPTFRPSTREMP